ncbi:uncharacterized protein KGF55_002469 [Candida pseudojiufengensis]|uniref:uncharacterized protein n=1 Tax=Candida pseudojiufengensis TaxID=497109 RepID=UPI00222577FA|nr:uncharacterized protein KGF55_002469 [Candida pseudojiufengensis]KAI5963589.1 hypothetical protein KGF55_002469 [Candida pseudojiufengensis]
MIEILITVIPSICWLLYRFYTILKTPVEKIIEDLNIEIPHMPNICIDSINDTSVVIHWDIEKTNDENLYYIILINGQEVASLTSSSCKLKNLSSNQVYTIEIIANNSITNFKSKSKPVIVQTINRDNIEKIINLENLENDIVRPLDIEESDLQKIGALEDENSSTISIDQIKEIDDSKLLNLYLIKTQNELTKANLEYKNFQTQAQLEQKHLQDDLNFYKHEFEEETDTKNKKDHDVKSLEKSKNNLSFQKSKLISQLNSIKSSLALYQNKFKESDLKVKKLEERNLSLPELEEQEKLKLEVEINQIKENMRKNKAEYDKVDENIKNLTLEKKELTSILSQFKLLIELLNSSGNNNSTINQIHLTENSPSPSPGPNGSSTSLPASNAHTNSNINTSIFNKDGTLTKNSFDALLRISQLIPSWQDEIMQEINNYQELENQWKNAFRAEIKKFVSIHQSLEIAKLSRDDNYQPVKLSEYQASIEFGGYSNALPKPKFNNNQMKNNYSIDDYRTGSNGGTNFHSYYAQTYGKNEDTISQSPVSAQPALNQAQLYPQYQTDDQQNILPQPTNPLQIYDYLPDQSQFETEHPYVSLEQINAAQSRNIDMSLNSPTLPNNLLNLNNLGLVNDTTFQNFNFDDQYLPQQPQQSQPSQDLQQPPKVTSPLPPQNEMLFNNFRSTPTNDFNSRLYHTGYNNSGSSFSEVWNPQLPTVSSSTNPNPNQSTFNEFLTPTNTSTANNTNPNNNVGTSNLAKGFLMTPSSQSIWLDEKSNNGHTRSISNNSQIWRNDLFSMNSLHGQSNNNNANNTTGINNNNSTISPNPTRDYHHFFGQNDGINITNNNFLQNDFKDIQSNLDNSTQLASNVAEQSDVSNKKDSNEI